MVLKPKYDGLIELDNKNRSCSALDFGIAAYEDKRPARIVVRPSNILPYYSDDELEGTTSYEFELPLDKLKTLLMRRLTPVIVQSVIHGNEISFMQNGSYSFLSFSSNYRSPVEAAIKSLRPLPKA